MGIIRNHLDQMKVEDPKEYQRLMDVYGSETELLQEVLNLTEAAVQHYNHMKQEGKKTG
jgi:hypothetical protein